MTIQNISFGKKIPVSQFKVKDIKRNKLVYVDMSEYDCKDDSDMQDVLSLASSKKWIFYSSVARNMKYKTANIKAGRKDLSNFYVVNNKDGEIIGLCQTFSNKNDIDIFYLETRHDRYKYVGQSLLAVIGKLHKNSGKNISVNSATGNARMFYKQACGFDYSSKMRNLFSFELTNDKINDFVRKVKEKTGSSFLIKKGNEQ